MLLSDAGCPAIAFSRYPSLSAAGRIRPGAGSPRVVTALPGKRIPKRFQVVIIQRHQPALWSELERMREPGLRHLHIPKLALVASEVVVENRFVGQPLHSFEQDGLCRFDRLRPARGVSERDRPLRVLGLMRGEPG